MPSYCLQEGKSIIKVRPKSELGNWGPAFWQEVFIDTLAPIIDTPDINASVGDTTITLLADAIADDTSATTDVSMLDKVIFRAQKDSDPQLVQEYDVSGSLNSPVLSHSFSISPTTNCTINWQIEVSDIAGNKTLVNAYNIFNGIDSQLDIANLFDDISRVDSGVVISHRPGTGYIIPTLPIEPIPTFPIEPIQTEALGDRAITTEQYLNVLSIINTDDIANSSTVINLGTLQDSGVIQTEQYLQILSIINTTDIGQSSQVIQLSALEEAGIIQTENIGGTSIPIFTSQEVP
jgi:hypothetical protein